VLEKFTYAPLVPSHGLTQNAGISIAFRGSGLERARLAPEGECALSFASYWALSLSCPSDIDAWDPDVGDWIDSPPMSLSDLSPMSNHLIR
jgi:hypothetical protein